MNMGAFFETLLGNMYAWFDFFYCHNLSEHLWGWDMNTQAYTKELSYNTIGLYTLLISALVMATYYYFIDHPRFCKWWSWTIMAVINSLLCLLLGYYCVYADYESGMISDDLMYVKDEHGQVVSQLIYESDCWGFGMSNMIIAILFFLGLSLIFKRWSIAAKHSPF